LRLYPKDEGVVLSYLNSNHYVFHSKSNHIEVTLRSSMESINLLNDLKDSLNAVEVLQGTLDDVFLNITGHQLI